MNRLISFITLCIMGVSYSWAQKTFNGRVTDENGLSVPGITVVEKVNQKNGVITDIDGKWTLNLPSGNSILVFTAIGMEKVEIAAKDASKVKMKDDTASLAEVVVVGYGSGRSITSTSASVVKVGGKEMENKPTANPFDALQGKVTGLQIFTSSGEPSKLSSFRIHGVGSLSASSIPLIILDGMPVDRGTIRDLNYDDFESVQVLKDASATSIYGSRAANGVIYITTKKGKVSKDANITLSTQYGISNLANKDYYESMMNADELYKFLLETRPKEKARFEQMRKKYTADTKWHEYYFKKDRPTYQASLAISGGAKNIRYYLSGGMFSQEGLRYRSGFKKYNFNSRLNGSINKYISLGIKNTITYNNYRRNRYIRSRNGGLSIIHYPFYSPYYRNGKEYYDVKIPGLNLYSPRYLADKSPVTNNMLNFISLGDITVKPIPNLMIQSKVGLKLGELRVKYNRLPSYAGSLGNGESSESFARYIDWTLTNIAEYKFNIADDHNFTFLIGQEYLDKKYNQFSGEGQGLVDDRLLLLGSTTKDKAVGSGFSENATLSYFGLLSYNYKKKYIVDLSLRNDASSRFGKNNKNAIFGSVGLLWKLKEESFFQKVEWLDLLNLKFSMGTSGNSAIEDYESLALAGEVKERGKIRPYKGKTGWGIVKPGNPNLTWERQRKTTIGLEARILDRLGINIELYHRLTSDMLMNVPYPYTTGFSSIKIKDNVGEYQNQGIDLNLKYDIYKNSDVYVNAYINFSYNQDKVKSLFHNLSYWYIPDSNVAYIVGEPIKFMAPIFKQINPQTGAPEWYIPDDKNIAKIRKDKITSTFNEDVLMQNTGIDLYPPINGGWGVNASFKGFYLQADFVLTLGKNTMVDDAFFVENPTQFINTNHRKIVRDYWKKPGDKTRFPSLKYRFTEFDTRMIKDASFMRFKNFTLGYKVPKRVLRNQNIIKGAKIYFNARNLITWTGFTGPDPEVGTIYTVGANPNTKQTSLGLVFNF